MADKRNNDSWAKEVRKRIINEIDLVASEARYHAHCFSDFFKPPSNENRGRPLNPKVSSAMEEIFSYIEHNNDCQFTITELKNILTDYVPDDKTITRKLLERYGDRISIVSKTTGPSIICFLDTQYDILNDTWYTDRKNQNTENQTAAAIINRDIREQICDTKFYPPSDKILDRNYSFIPKSSMLFLEELIVRNKKGKIEPLLTKCMGIAHSIVSAIKSRSFLSPLLIGIAVVLHRRFGSKRILDILSSLGFSASYKEAQLYEASALFHPQPQIPVGSFVQYVFDNADFNVGTIDGLNTFHSMGGIEIVTPAGAIPADTPMMRRQAMPTAAEIRAIGHVPVLVYEGSSEAALSKIQVESVADREAGIISESSIHQCDLLWMWAKWQKIPKIPGWNGFMEAITQNKSVEKSKIICLPFVNEPPSNYNTIYTSLNVALDRARNLEQKTCIVTFDQPLYAKAREIVAASGDGSEVSRIIVRLGGFHLMMSFLGSIGYIMAGSGLKEIFSTIYAPISADKMLTGHAYARAMRGHILVQLALVKLILEEITVDAEDCDSIGCILESFEENPPSFELIENAAEIRKLKEKFDEKILELKNRGATSKLLIQYIQMVAIAKEFLRAERTSDWRMHLASIRKMLPYFHAAGHFPYAKSAHLYLQDMQKLEETMDMDEFKKFTDQGFFAVRRTSKQWGGNWTDMTIEQSLMKSMKVTGGIIHGRGTTESVLSRWILGMPAAHNISEEIEKLCGISFDNVDQHVDTRDSRIKRDESDSDKLLQWLSSHQPFPDIERIMSIATGVVGSDKINCQNAQEIGEELLNAMVGKKFTEIKLKRSDRVLPLLSINSNVKINGDVVPVDPLLLFQRITVTKQSDEDLRDCFKYELSPYPLALFDEGGMRKGKKSALFDAFELKPVKFDVVNFKYVIDGGFLLHRVVWHQNQTFSDICGGYINYVKKNYGSNAIIVFDGYQNTISTKSWERLRRSTKFSSTDILFDETMIATMSQEKFLSNENNKNRLITMLLDKFRMSNYTSEQALDDADTLIVNTAIKESEEHSTVVVGEDIHLLVLLTALTPADKEIIFLKPGKGKIERKVYSSKSLKNYATYKEHILFLHAVTGCDTTSGLFNKGKVKAFKLLQTHKDLQSATSIYTQPDKSHQDLLDAGVRFPLALYGAPVTENSIDIYRYKCFSKSVARCKVGKLAILPPTQSAAEQHLYRVYHQVQSWLGNNLPAEDWGWTLRDNILTPKTTSKPAAPDSLMKMIFCNCTKGCGLMCGCRKAGLRCSAVCGKCLGKHA